MNMPSITPEMILVFVGQVIAVAVAFGVNLSPDQQKSILALSASVGAMILWASVQHRKSRAQNADKISAAQEAAKPINVTVAPTTSAPTDTPFEKPQMQEIGRSKSAPRPRRRAAKP